MLIPSRKNASSVLPPSSRVNFIKVSQCPKSLLLYNISFLQQNLMEQDIIGDYQKRADAAAAEADKYKKLSDNYSLMRLAVFALFILAVVVSVSLNSLVLLAVSALVL